MCIRDREWAGLTNTMIVKTADLVADLNTDHAQQLRRSLFQKSITVLRNEGTLPVRGLDTLRIASLVIGDTLHCAFQQGLGRYARIDEFRCDKVLNKDSATSLLAALKPYDLVIASVHGTSFKVEKEFGIPQITLDFLRRLGDQNTLALSLIHISEPTRTY